MVLVSLIFRVGKLRSLLHLSLSSELHLHVPLSSMLRIDHMRSLSNLSTNGDIHLTSFESLVGVCT